MPVTPASWRPRTMRGAARRPWKEQTLSQKALTHEAYAMACRPGEHNARLAVSVRRTRRGWGQPFFAMSASRAWRVRTGTPVPPFVT
jgi:hypothetical protein